MPSPAQPALKSWLLLASTARCSPTPAARPEQGVQREPGLPCDAHSRHGNGGFSQKHTDISVHSWSVGTAGLGHPGVSAAQCRGSTQPQQAPEQPCPALTGRLTVYFWISRTYFFQGLPNNVQNSRKRGKPNPMPAARCLRYFA